MISKQYITACTLIGLMLYSAQDLLAANPEKNKNRESTKLQPIGIENLSVQSLISVYTSCVTGSLTKDEATGKSSTTLGDLRNTCKDERKNLSSRIPTDGLNQLDEFYVTAFNSAMAKKNKTAENP